METLREIIKELRDLGMTQDQVAEELRLSQAHISNIERGKRGNRTPAETLDRARTARDHYKVLEQCSSAKNSTTN